MSEEELDNQESESALEAPEQVDLHDLEMLKKLWYLLKNAEKSQEVFTVIRLLLDSMPYDWIDTKEAWLHIAHKLEEQGVDELASLFKLANQKAFELSLKGQ